MLGQAGIPLRAVGADLAREASQLAPALEAPVISVKSQPGGGQSRRWV